MSLAAEGLASRHLCALDRPDGTKGWAAGERTEEEGGAVGEVVTGAGVASGEGLGVEALRQGGD
jgi:hypothetical protein